MSCAEITVLEALAARLADIRTSNAFETDIGARVYDAEPEPAEAPNGPFLVLGAIAAVPLDVPADSWTIAQKIMVCVDGQEMEYRAARDLALDAMRDMDRAMRGNPDWGATVLQARIASKSLPRRTSGGNYLIATVSVEIDYLDED